MLQTDNSDPCEFYFVWQTPAACPVKKSSSAPDQPCSVTDPLYHMTFNLSTLRRQQDYHVITGRNVFVSLGFTLCTQCWYNGLV